MGLKTGTYKVENMENKYWDMSSTHFYGGNYELALEDLKLYNLLDKDNPQTYERIGSCYYMMGDKKNAIENWNTSLFLDPDSQTIKAAIERTKQLMEEEKDANKERKKQREDRQKQAGAISGDTQLLGVFPSQSKAYAYAQKLREQGMTASVEETDGGKWAVKVPKSQIKKGQ
jgi:tetratricopeptide (TPR) repeat protein